MAANIRCIMRAKAPYGQGITKMKVKLNPEQSSTPSLMPETNSVYLRRVTEGTGELMELVGGTVAWNQLCNSSSVTGTSGHKFYLKKSGVESITDTNTFTGLTDGVDMVTDLTQMLGTAIADYVYSLEQATAGSGIAWLKSYNLIDGAYHAYSAPTLQSVEATSHVTRGKNLADKATTIPSSSDLTVTVDDDGVIHVNGTTTASRYIRGTFDCPDPTATYTWAVFNTTAFSNVEFSVRNDDTSSAGGWSRLNAVNKTLTFTPDNGSSPALWQIVIASGVTLNNAEFKPMIVKGSTAPTTYEPYVKRTYPLDSDLVLRGIPMKDADGNLYYDGDTYEWDGTVTRKYGYVDMGTLSWGYASSGQGRFNSEKPTGIKLPANQGVVANIKTAVYVADTVSHIYAGVVAIGVNTDGRVWVHDTTYGTDANAFKTAMSGVYLVYELATPTTESADPYTAVQTVEDGGTEEFTTSNNVPVGVIGRFANAVPMEGVDSFTVTADDGTTHTYPVTLSEEVYSGYVDMLTGEAVSDMASIAEYNGETINAPWLSSLDVYSAGATPTKGAQVVYPITAEEVTATITDDPSTLSGVVSATSTEGTVDWSELSEIGIKCIMKRKNPFQ